MTDEFARLRMGESSDDFAHAVKAALSPELLTKWTHDRADPSTFPFGRDCHDVSDADRVRLVSEANALGAFIVDRMNELMELVPAVDQALQRMTRR